MREITLAGLLAIMRRGLWIVAVMALLGVVAAALMLRAGGPVYTAWAIVAPAERDLGAASRIAAELERYASLATLAQTPVKLEQVSPLERYAELIGSLPLAERLEAEHGLLRELFVDRWDETSGEWRPPTGLAALKLRILRFFGHPGWQEPTPATLAQFLGDRIEVLRSGASSLRRLEMEHPDRNLAARLLQLVHEGADDLLREQARDRVQAEIEHLNTVLAAADREPRQQALRAMLAEHYQAEALLTADLPYAAELVSPPRASLQPTSPGPLLVLGLGGVVGIILGVFAVFLREALREG